MSHYGNHIRPTMTYMHLHYSVRQIFADRYALIYLILIVLNMNNMRPFTRLFAPYPINALLNVVHLSFSGIFSRNNSVF